MIAVFPQGIDGDGGSSWQGAPYANPAVDDLTFVSDLIQYMETNYCIDPNRIYASGKSNGAGFVDTIACNPQGELFAAFSMVSAALYTEADGSVYTPRSTPAPILEYHGTDDTTIRYNGGTSHQARYPSIPSWLARWAVRNGCPSDATPETTNEDEDEVHRTKYTCSGMTDIVQGVKTDGQGHWWPSKETNDENDGDVAPIEASVEIMNWFRMYTRQ